MADGDQANLDLSDAGKAAADAASSSAAAGATPSVSFDDLKAAGLPETYFADGKFNAKDLAAHLTEGTALKTQAEERAKLIPADGKYNFDLPKDFDAPKGADGKPIAWNPDAAFTGKVAEYAKANGFTQEQMTGLVGLYAAQQAQKITSDQAFFSAEMAKLGDAQKANARAETIWNFMKANVGEESAKAIGMTLTTAASVEAMEKLINLANGRKMASATGGNDAAQNANGEAAKLVGTKGGGRKLLQAANSAKN